MNLTICTDAGRIDRLIQHPSIKPASFEVGMPDISMGVTMDRVTWLVFTEHGKDGGFMAIDRRGLYWLDYHGGVLPAYRGAWALQALKTGIRFMFQTMGAHAITTHTPASNIGAQRINAAAGLKRTGIVPRAFYNGSFQDLVIYSINRSY